MSTAERELLATIRARANDYARGFHGTQWHPDELSDLGWLCLVAVPYLLHKVENQGQHGNANGNPTADGIGLPQTPVQFVQAEQALTLTTAVVPSGNPFAKFLVVHLAKLVGVRFHAVQSKRTDGPDN